MAAQIRFLRTIITVALSLLMMQPYALANAPKLTAAEKIQIIKKANPKTIGEFWNAIKPHMRSDIRARYEVYLKPYHNVRIPKMKFTRDGIVLKSKGKMIRLSTNHVLDGNIKINNKLVWYDNAGDPEKMMDAVDAALHPERYSFFNQLFMPQAHAFSWMTLLLGALGGWLLSMWFSPTEAASSIFGSN